MDNSYNFFCHAVKNIDKSLHLCFLNRHADELICCVLQALLVAEGGGAALAGLRSQLTTLLYRQLVELQGIVPGAATTHELLGWVEQLQQCGNTIMHRRIIC